MKREKLNFKMVKIKIKKKTITCVSCPKTVLLN